MCKERVGFHFVDVCVLGCGPYATIRYMGGVMIHKVRMIAGGQSGSMCHVEIAPWQRCRTTGWLDYRMQVDDGESHVWNEMPTEEITSLASEARIDSQHLVRGKVKSGRPVDDGRGNSLA